MPNRRRVTLVSHGPGCLDGLTAAVVGARYFSSTSYRPLFASNREIDELLCEYNPADPSREELWITDISWSDGRTTSHLDSLVERGLKLYWVDHHKSAVDSREAGRLDAAFTDFVLDTQHSACRLLFDYLCRRVAERGESRPGLLALRNLVLLADDVDRWVLQIEGSRELALTVRAMPNERAYRALLSMDSNITYGPELQKAHARVHDDVEATLRAAEATLMVRELPELDLVVVAAECDGYTGEVADRWRGDYRRAVFSLYDRHGRAISFRRTEDCPVDLSRLAASLGGGGHEAAAGAEVDLEPHNRSQAIVAMVGDALQRGADR